jgi:hypothetical protein
LARTEPTWTGRNADSAADRIILLEVGRSTKTYRAVIELGSRGYGEQAAMLNRALFESMAVARWINENEETAVERFPQAVEFEDHLYVERLKNTGWLEPEEEKAASELAQLTEEQLEHLRDEFGDYNQKLWTGHCSVRRLLDDIRGQFNAKEWKLIENYLRTGHHENNQLLHSTVGALSKAYVHLDEDRYGIWTGPSDLMVGRVLFSAHMIYQQTLILAAERFDLADRDGLNEVLARAQVLFMRFRKDEVKDVGRNDPCPCDSGKKFKHCHWDQVHRPAVAA